MAKLNDLIVTIGARTREFDKKLGQSIRKLQRFGSSTKRIGKNMTQAITMPIIGIGAAALKSAADLEAMEASFVSLTGGAKGAADMMANLNQFAANTPFQIEDIANSAKQLLASGTDISQVNNQLQFLGDIAATSGKPINELAAIFAKVNAKGKVELESLNQLAERGIPIFTALSEATGLPADKLGAGAVSVDQFNEVLKSMAESGGFAEGAMLRLSQTASGKFSTALDNLKQAGASLAESFLPAVKEALDKFTEFAKKITALSPENKKLALTIAGIAAALGPILVVLPSIVQSFMLLASPTGLIIAGVTTLVGLIGMFGSSAKDAQDEVDKLKEKIKDLSVEQSKRLAATELEALQKELREEQRIYEALKNQTLAGDAVDQKIHYQTLSRHKLKIDGLNESIKAIKHEISNKEMAAEADKRLAMFAEKAEQQTKKKSAAVSDFTTKIGFLLTSLNQVKSAPKVGDLLGQLTATEVGPQTGDLLGQLGAASFEVQIQKAEEAHTQATEQMKANNEALRNSYIAMANKLSGTFSSLFSGLLAGTQTFGEFMKKTITDLLIKLASMVAAFAVLNVLTGGAGTVGGQTLKQFLGGGFGFGLPMMAEGGIVSGKTALIAGEYAGAKSNPEVIAPLDKLQSLLGNAGGQVQVYGTLSGKDILLSSERAGIDRNRVRGF